MKCIIQKQYHGSLINIVDKTTSLWIPGDGMITFEKDLALITYGSDCSIIVFWDQEKIGVCHAGWKGLTEGLIDEMVEEFKEGQCYVGPLLNSFEIRPDDCYEKIVSFLGEKYFNYSNDKIFFNFKEAVIDRLKSIPFGLDGRDTFSTRDLASWRRDKKRGNGTQNRIAVWRDSKSNSVYYKLFLPGESVKKHFAEK